MTFDIPLHIPDNSPESDMIERITQSQQISPQEAVLNILREASKTQNPAQKMIGLFAKNSDTALVDEALSTAVNSRNETTTRNIGV
jgi:hypothetical protein